MICRDRRHILMTAPTDLIPSPQSQAERLAALDSVRGLAILLVVIFHYLYNHISNVYLAAFVGPFGLGGVSLFFLLSGFLIERHLNYDDNLARYFSRRFFRIFPAYLTCLAIIFSIDAIAPNGRVWMPRDVGANAFLLQDLLGAPLMRGVIWTLLIEIKFYLLAPFVKRMGKAALRLAPCIVLLFNAGVVAFRGEASTLLTYLAFCLIGMQFGPWQRREISDYSLAALVVVTALATCAFGTYFNIGLGIFVVTNAAILALALRRPITIPLLPFIGRISYSWYLYHAAIGYPLMAALTASLQGLDAAAVWMSILVTTAVTIAAAWASYAFLEVPAIALGRRIEIRLIADSGISAGHP